MIAKPAHPSDEEMVDAKVILAPAIFGKNGATRTLPHSLEAEEYLLSTILLDGEPMMVRCIEAKIRPDSFYEPRHGTIFAELVRMRAAGKPIDVAALAEELRDRKLLEQIGGFAFVAQVSSRIPTTAQSAYFLSKVREQATLREIIRAATSAVEECYDHKGDLSELTSDLRRRLDFAIEGPQRAAELWPSPVSAANLCSQPPVTPDVLIEGMLYSIGTMLLSGPSKSHKTFSALDVAIAIASGAPWLGYRTTQSNVLYLNLELQDFATEDRIARICSARGIKPPAGLHIWNLRGMTVTLNELTIRLPEMIHKLGIRVVAIDPHYKVSAVSDMEENSNDNQGKLLTLMEGLCAKAGAALILTHHFAKGDASNKNAIDRASGGGVFARWGDVMLTFTPHEEDDAMSVEMSLRNFAPVEPFVVRWEYPRWIRDQDLDPAKLKTSRGPKVKNSPNSALHALGDKLLSFAEWEKACGFSNTTFKRKRQELLDSGQVEQVGPLYRKKSD